MLTIVLLITFMNSLFGAPQEEGIGKLFPKNGDLWTNHQETQAVYDILGYIGNDCKRLRIHFSSVTPDKGCDSVYHVTGSSMVMDNLCDFTGTLKIASITEINKEEREKNLEIAREAGDKEWMERNRYSKYVIKGSYLLNEEASQRGAGIFKGTFETFFYVKNDSILYDDLDLMMSDSFKNNQFKGTWQPYGKENTKPCCWGDYRIPDCGDLDVGCAEFVPNERYGCNQALGWSDLYKALVNHNKDAAKREKARWWR